MQKMFKIMTSILAGQCDVGIVNSYYFGRLQAEDPNIPLKTFFGPIKNCTGTHVNVSGLESQNIQRIQRM